MGTTVNSFSISVIIPAYNAEKTIIRALESVRQQTASEYIEEVLVVNDGSTDNTEECIEQYKKKYPYFLVKLISKKNGGVSSARNTGIKLAKGNWIALLDSDDEWFKDKIAKQVEILKKNSSIDFLGGNHTSQVLKILGKPIEKMYRPSVKELYIKMFPQTSTVVFKKKIFEEIGGFDEYRKYGEDGQFFCKICENYNYYYSPDQVISFDGGRRGFGISGLSGNLKEMQKGGLQNFRELYERNSISFVFYVCIVAFSQLKYLRRIFICKMEKK